jgi:hypothetical protein
MLKTGLPDIEITNQINFLAKKYGVRYHNMGCVTEKSKLDSIKKVNDSISLIVASRFGKKWLRNLHASLDSTDKIKEIVYIELLRLGILHDRAFYYLVTPGIQENEYLVKVYEINYEDDKSQVRTHYNVGVDFRKHSVVEVTNIPN